jgi:hypothetical protein
LSEKANEQSECDASEQRPDPSGSVSRMQDECIALALKAQGTSTHEANPSPRCSDWISRRRLKQRG